MRTACAVKGDGETHARRTNQVRVEKASEKGALQSLSSCALTAIEQKRATRVQQRGVQREVSSERRERGEAHSINICALMLMGRDAREQEK
jgi:hypothetical protein